MKRRLLWTALLAIAIGILVLLLVLIGVGYLRLPHLPGAGTPSVTISEVKWTVEQGQTSSGQGWFGPSQFNQTQDEGYPLTVSAGSSIKLIWPAFNRDSVSHTVYSVAVSAPFQVLSSSPSLPCQVAAGDDSAFFDFEVEVPSSASGSYTLSVTVDAQP